MGKVNIGTRSVGFDVSRKQEREKRGTRRRLHMDDLTNRGIEVTIEEMEKEMSELKRKMREFTKTEREGEKARGQKVKEIDRRRL